MIVRRIALRVRRTTIASPCRSFTLRKSFIVKPF